MVVKIHKTWDENYLPRYYYSKQRSPFAVRYILSYINQQKRYHEMKKKKKKQTYSMQKEQKKGNTQN